MTQKQTSQRSASEPDRPTDTDRIDDQRKHPGSEQAVQPEEGTPRAQQEQQIRSQSDAGSKRVEDRAGDDVTSAPESGAI
jgi:hypothetical protein